MMLSLNGKKKKKPNSQLNLQSSTLGKPHLLIEYVHSTKSKQLVDLTLKLVLIFN